MPDSNNPALLGGQPIRTKPFPQYPPIGEEEKRAVLAVLESGNLSTFAASPGGIRGGETIQRFEALFAESHEAKHAIAVNSGTAGLHCALAALGCGPGHEVIVTPYTFTATATSVLMHNSIPIFSDVESRTFNLDPDLLEGKITARTKAIIPVHLFGHPAQMDSIMAVARKHGLAVVEDACQAPGAKFDGRFVGTIGDLGVFSFQETKNISVGEGGMITTNSDDLAERCRMIRNHGEVIIEGQKREYLSNIVGWNYRMTEIEAAIGVEQLKKFDRHQLIRKELFHYLSDHLREIPGLEMPYIAPNVVHSYHAFAMKFDEATFGCSRDTFVKAMLAEGIPLMTGYPRPLYENPIFKQRIAYGDKGCPFTCSQYPASIEYKTGDCPVTEDLCYRSVVSHFFTRPPATENDMEDIVRATAKIHESAGRLREFENG